MSRQPNGPQEETVFGLPPRAPGVSAVAPARAMPSNAALEEKVAANPAAPSVREYAVRFEQDLEAPPEARGPMTGHVLAERYRLGRLLGEGGMGYVYEAVHLAIEKRFAVKVLAQEFCNHPTHVERFLREAKTTSKIDHDNVVEISDSGPTPDGSVFFVMEYLEGEDLGALIEREGPQTWERTRHFMLQLCEALAAAHAHGVVHRDIKPQNCFRTTRRRNPDFLKVLDFGIAKLLGEEHMAGKKLTRSGQIFGTPEYMSPEQIRGMPADPRMDVYAAGVIMYELLIGRTPFEGETALDVLTKHIHDPIPALGTSLVGASRAKQIDAVIAGALAKDASRRFQTADELATAIIAVESAGETQKVVEPSLDGAPATLAGVRRAGSRSTVMVPAVIGAVLAVVAVVALFVFPGFLNRAESTPAESGNAGVRTSEKESTPADNTSEPAEPPVVARPIEPTAPPEVGDLVPPDAAPAEPVPAEPVPAKPVPAKPVPAEPAVDPKPVAKPSLKPKQADVDRKVRAVVEGKCQVVALSKWEKGETVTVKLSLQEKTGKVGEVTAKHSADKTKISACIEKNLRESTGLVFPVGRDGGKYTVMLRPS